MVIIQSSKRLQQLLLSMPVGPARLRLRRDMETGSESTALARSQVIVVERAQHREQQKLTLPVFTSERRQ
jgi:hypothetical protein